jgi:LuxR family transcriptional regulator, maltose regulon positive regulatory protein
VLQSKIFDHARFPSADSELRVQSALLISLAYRQPSNNIITFCAQRVLELLDAKADANLQAISAAYLVVYGITTGPLDLARRARPKLERLIAEPEVTVLTAGWGWFVLSFSHCVIWDEARAKRAVERVADMGRTNGLPPLVRLAAIIGAHVELCANRLDAARNWAALLDQVINHDHLYDRASNANVKVTLAMHTAQHGVATASAKIAIELFDEAGTHFHRTIARVNQAMISIGLGDSDTGECWAQEAAAMASETNGWLTILAPLLLAHSAITRNDADSALAHFSRSLNLAKQMECLWPFRYLRPVMPTLCALALRGHVESDFVRNLIRLLDLRAPGPGFPEWPWPIRVFALGPFHIMLDGQVLTFSRKSPKKALSLLKAIIAMGGRGVRLGRLIDSPWPDMEGDAALEAMEQALHRPRRILGRADSVVLEDGNISLNDTLVWTDVQAFESLSAVELSASDLGNFLAIYQGEFLGDESEAPWAISTRERLRAKFIRGVETVGLHLEIERRWREATDLYLKGTDADTLNEGFYQGLMRCYAGQGNRAEALSVYRRLRQQLSVLLGVPPSASSEALARELRLR